MLRRTLFFSRPAYLRTRDEQLVVVYPHQKGSPTSKGRIRYDQPERTVPIEDIGIIILEHPQITITHRLLGKLIQHNVAVIHCDSRHHPLGMIMPLEGHSAQSERIRQQIEASLPLKKNLWKQTVEAKINNQARLLDRYSRPVGILTRLARKVTSGDRTNCEAQAAVHYWKHLFPAIPDFVRDRWGPPPNNLLNYGYAVLRAIAARALVGSGLLPVIGFHHRSKYNAYCLADDIMEPYRPFVDRLVLEITETESELDPLTPHLKAQLVRVATTDVWIGNKRSPLMVAMSRTTHSLAACYAGASRKILYPTFDP